MKTLGYTNEEQEAPLYKYIKKNHLIIIKAEEEKTVTPGRHFLAVRPAA